tara:strand:- start:438 stop:734 length:297 start_codon:yes stop_codon:yes gene_type:complete
MGNVFLFLVMSVGYSQPPEEPLNDPQEQNDPGPSEDAEGCQEGVQDLKKSMLSLEFYLQDKKDYKHYCPYAEWEQPQLEIYKEEPKSYLPKDCKAEKI